MRTTVRAGKTTRRSHGMWYEWNMTPRNDIIELLSRQDWPEDCVVWPHSPSTRYGRVFWEGKQQTVHRLTYEACRGPLGSLHIDHLCKEQRCCNPLHLEAVTASENARRRNADVTHCPYGHEYTEENTHLYPTKKGHTQRCCRACGRRRTAEWRTNIT